MSDTEQLPLFSELGLAAPVLKALQDVGYERPSPIQAAAIPHHVNKNGNSEPKTAPTLIKKLWIEYPLFL